MHKRTHHPPDLKGVVDHRRLTRAGMIGTDRHQMRSARNQPHQPRLAVLDADHQPPADWLEGTIHDQDIAPLHPKAADRHPNRADEKGRLPVLDEEPVEVDGIIEEIIRRGGEAGRRPAFDTPPSCLGISRVSIHRLDTLLRRWSRRIHSGSDRWAEGRFGRTHSGYG